MKLGKLAPKRSLKTRALGNYLNASKLPIPPTVTGWEKTVQSNWGMMKNDTLGDCTCAAMGHMVLNWTANSTSPITVSDEDVVKAYSAVSGYDPSTGADDNGAVELDCLNYWQSTGIAGHKISGFATIDVQNIDQVKAAIYLFGGVYTGFNVPDYAMNQDNWVVQNTDNQIIGGHAVPYFGYGRGGATCVTWGRTQPATWDFWQTYTDEAYAVVSPDWFKTTGLSPSGFDLAGLLADLKSV